MALNLRYYGDPILREHADTVTEFDDELRNTAAEMIETMYAEAGIGLAGPQVGLKQRILVALQMADSEDTDADPIVLVNPEVLERSRETWELEEGCLSIPKLNGRVTRPHDVKVRYQDLDGVSHELEASGMFARVLQHEIDHLNGKLFIDYLSPAQKSLIKPRLREIAAEYSS